MRQTWRDLLFLHWVWDAGDLQARLPEGLTVETFEGHAYLGLVPFFMRRVRPVGLPAVPWLSDFREMNVRTYVRDRTGRTGVWFFSLDCDQPVAVELARRLFRLPYQHAEMAGAPESGADYICRRRGRGDAAVRLRYRGAGAVEPARPGTVDEFLVERYRLFSGGCPGTGLRCGRVWHVPYRIVPAEWSGEVDAVFRWEGFRPPGRPPEHAVWSPGVEVEIHPLERAVREGKGSVNRRQTGSFL